ncbi:MAG: hypothetical protein ABR915_14625 [Thermoguttaceae bacterium]
MASDWWLGVGGWWVVLVAGGWWEAPNPKYEIPNKSKIQNRTAAGKKKSGAREQRSALEFAGGALAPVWRIKRYGTCPRALFGRAHTPQNDLDSKSLGKTNKRRHLHARQSLTCRRTKCHIEENLPRILYSTSAAEF